MKKSTAGHSVVPGARAAGQGTGTRDMTRGRIWQELLLFFFPLLAGTFFQMLYNTVDMFVVGRFLGTDAISAVGGTSATLVSLFVGLFVGLSAGSTVVVAQAFGAGRSEEADKAVHTSAAMALIIGTVLTVLAFVTAPGLLMRMHAPASSYRMSVTYLRVFSLGMIPNVIYNMGSGIFRAVGDSRRPFFFLVISSMANIVLDIVTVVVLRMGVAGAALATIASQALAAVLTVRAMIRTEEIYRLDVRRIRIEPVYLRRIVMIGIPSAIQSMMYSLSNIVIQSAVNGFGSVPVAAWAVLGKVDSIFWMISNSLGIAVTTFTGQNFGAGRLDRVYSGIRQAFAMLTAFSMCYGIFLWRFGGEMVSIFTRDPGVVSTGALMARIFGPAYISFVCIEIFTGALRGMGNTIVPTLITLIGVCAMRVVWILAVVPRFHTIEMVCYSYPVTWIIASVCYVVYYLQFKKKLQGRGASSAAG